MKVILRQDVPEFGSAGQTIEVKSGYGRNYLIPRNLAIPATKASVKAVDEIEKQKQIRQRKSRRAADIVKERIEKVSVSASVLVGEEDRVFGSVTANDIAGLLDAEGIKVDKRAIQLEEPIKALGVYTVPVKVDKDVTADLKVWVVKKS
jgi:large subunit ribosomal protein L9